MAKRNLKKEKAARNEEYAKTFRKESSTDRKPERKRQGLYANWCRVAGHPATCSCDLPSRTEVIEMSRGRR